MTDDGCTGAARGLREKGTRDQGQAHPQAHGSLCKNKHLPLGLPLRGRRDSTYREQLVSKLIYMQKARAITKMRAFLLEEWRVTLQ